MSYVVNSLDGQPENQILNQILSRFKSANILGFFPGPTTLLEKGCLEGHLLDRSCVFKALRLYFLPNFPGPTFIPCPMSIPEARVVKLEPT